MIYLYYIIKAFDLRVLRYMLWVDHLRDNPTPDTAHIKAERLVRFWVARADRKAAEERGQFIWSLLAIYYIICIILIAILSSCFKAF